MKRRQFIKATVATGVVLGLPAGVYIGLGADNAKISLTIDDAIRHLDGFAGKTLSNIGEWDPAQILNHCAQSVEYSMTGYPEHKSDLFKNTAGQLVFSIFSAKGSMTHSLSEPIPGAPLLQSDQPLEMALQRLQKSLTDFNVYEGELAPHFAYGSLSKSQYALAHVMHLNNHLQQIVVG
jgi:hypothetical protein